MGMWSSLLRLPTLAKVAPLPAAVRVKKVLGELEGGTCTWDPAVDTVISKLQTTATAKKNTFF